MVSRTDFSAAIVISEAVEVARAYSTDESAGFVNGVLDAMHRELRGA